MERLKKKLITMTEVVGKRFEGRIEHYILSDQLYSEEMSKVLERKYDDGLIYSPKFALFRANLINFGFSRGTERDFLAFCDHIKCIELYKIQQRTLFLCDFIHVDTDKCSYKEFIESLEKGEPMVLASYHYSNYKALVHYLLTLNVDLFIIAGSRQKLNLEDEALDLAYMYRTVLGHTSSITFITAEDKTSLVQVHQALKNQGTRPKILLIYIDGNIGQSGHQLKNGSYKFKGVDVSMREGLNILLAILRLPVFSVYMEDRESEIKIVFSNSYTAGAGVRDIISPLLEELESIVSTKDFFKWECLMYLHHWISNRASLPSLKSDEDKRIRVLSLGEWFYLDTYKYVYVQEK